LLFFLEFLFRDGWIDIIEVNDSDGKMIFVSSSRLCWNNTNYHWPKLHKKISRKSQKSINLICEWDPLWKKRSRKKYLWKSVCIKANKIRYNNFLISHFHFYFIYFSSLCVFILYLIYGFLNFIANHKVHNCL
jgi:hypothetical protein